MRFAFYARLGVIWVVVGATFAAEAADREPRRIGGLLDVDVLIENYASFLARKYDLTPEQDEYTRQLLHQKTDQFMDARGDELEVLVTRLFEVRGGAEMGQQELIDWGQQVAPLYEDAKAIIVSGNDEWRGILTPEQQRIHDADLVLMYESFDTTEAQLERIVSGEMSVEEFRHPRRYRKVSTREEPRTTGVSRPQRVDPQTQTGAAAGDVTQPAGELPPSTGAAPRFPDRPGDTPGARREVKPAPPGPRASARGGQSGAAERRTERRSSRSQAGADRRDPTLGGKDFESAWEKYVRDFIAKYQLNESQSQRALAILDTCKQRANRYLKSRRMHLERIERDLAELAKSDAKDVAAQRTNLNKRQQDLLEPIGRIFDRQLKPRLERLPTRAQKKAAEESGVKLREPTTPGSAKDDDKAAAERMKRLEALKQRAEELRKQQAENEDEPAEDPEEEEEDQ